MLRRTLVKHRYHTRKKYPHLVLYNKAPWEVIPAEGPESHELLAHHYAQFLELCGRTRVANAVQDFHPEIPPEKWLHLLPGSVYVCPNVRSMLGNAPDEWGPYQWTPHKMPSEWLHHYGVVEERIGKVESVFQFKSPDLRLLCNAVCLSDVRCLSGVSSVSTLASVFEATAAAAAAEQGTKKNSEALKDITLFHFFRPNRAPSELVQPLERFWQHHPDLSMLEAFEDPQQQQTSWKPVVAPVERKKGVRATMPPFKPLQQYTIGLPERAAVAPGGCFGSRALMWGYWF